MKKMISSIFMTAFFVFSLLSLGSAADASAADVVIVGNKSVSVSSIDKDAIKDIFKGNKTTWDDGSKIDFVILKGSDVHKAFVKDFLGTSTSQFDRHWRRLVFTGKGSLPRAFDSESSLVNYVANNNGAIGYVASGADTGSTKVITVK